MQRRLLVLLLLLAAFFRLGAIDYTLTEQQAVALALEKNLTLSALRVELSAQLLQSESAWGALVPSLSAGGTLSHANQPSTPQPPSLPYQWSGSALLQASVTLSASLIQGVETARLQYLSGRISFEEAEQQIVLQVRKAFYQIILQGKQMEVTRASIATAEQTLAQVSADYANGRVQRLVLRQAELGVQNARLLLERELVQNRNSEALMKDLLGIAQSAAINLLGTIEVAPAAAPDVAGASVDERPDVRSASETIAVEESKRRVALLSILTPAVTLSASYAPAIADPFNTGSNPASSWGDRGAITLTVSASSLMAFLPFVPQRVNLAVADSAIASLRIRKAEVIAKARTEIESLLRSLEASGAAIDSLNQQSALAQESYDLAHEAYSAGSVDFLSLQVAEEDLMRARYDLLSEKYSYLATLIDLEHATGLTLRSVGGN
ncbi:MAG TPA: TolC family protein [Spirochaetia bacterium]|nr:TolC family protein [Spirochaetia bacterium]